MLQFKIGYTKISSSKATIYIAEMTERDSVVYRIDALIEEEEKFFDLKFVEKFKIIILNKDSHMKRYLPWLKGSGYSVSLSLANLIYIGPTARRLPMARYLVSPRNPVQVRVPKRWVVYDGFWCIPMMVLGSS